MTSASAQQRQPVAEATDARPSHRTSVLWSGGILVAVLVALGLALRLWFLFHATLNSDEAVEGFMARGILHGHLRAIIPGRAYGGSEAYVTSILFLVFGQGAFAVKLTPVVLTAAAALLTWRIGLRLVGDRFLSALAGAAVWVLPYAGILNSLLESGFRALVLACGLGAMLIAARIRDGVDSPGSFVALGLMIGLGWWTSPEIVYYLVPTAVLLAEAIVHGGRQDALRTWLTRSALALGAAAVAAAPWIWANVRSGFRSLQTTAFGGAAVHTTYGYRLGIFFRRALPMELNLTQIGSGNSVVPHRVEVVLHYGLLAAIVGGGALCAWMRPRTRCLVAFIALFPFLYALQPGTWYWQDGRYAIFLAPVVLLLAASTCEVVTGLVGSRFRAWSLALRRSMAAGLMGAAVLAASVGTVALFQDDYTVLDAYSAGFFSNWTSPEQTTVQAVAVLERGGVRAGYADYWVAGPLDFISGGRLQIATLDSTMVIAPGIQSAVSSAAAPAWLFVPPANLARAWWQFGLTPEVASPSPSVSMDGFVARLASLGITYREVRTSEVVAIVPSRAVTPGDLGL